MSLRVEVFAFLLQVQHARHTLAEATQLSSNGTKALSGLRHRLVWLIKYARSS